MVRNFEEMVRINRKMVRLEGDKSIIKV